VDGSGTTDLVLAYSDRVELYLNQSGNSFADPLIIKLPEPFTDIDQISFADILGHGTSALVLTKLSPTVTHWYHNFCGKNEDQDHHFKTSLKPYLLTRINNNLGATTEIKYSSSTRFYLEDKQAGRPWLTKLAFPVQVVEQIIVTDHISGSRLTNSFKYHDGYYDSEERQFRGFGFVESWDTEIFEAFSQSEAPADFPAKRLNQELYVPPVYTKTWYHTGAYPEAGLVSNHYRQDYFSGDEQAYQLPNSRFEPAIEQGNAETLRQAYSALKGRVLRQEVYAEDQTENLTLSDKPFTVTESNYQVKLLQPLANHRHAVFLVQNLETLTYNYERNPHDPRIQHDFVLEITPFGDVKKACTVFYGRRLAQRPEVYVYPEQAELKATVQLAEFINQTGPFWLIGVPYEQRTFELSHLDFQGQPYFTYDGIREQIDEALNHQIPYGVAFDPTIRQARLFTWQQSYFWNTAQDEALDLGQITERALPHHERQAVFTDEWLQAVYGDKLDRTLLSRESGYVSDENGVWWNRGLVQHYYNSDQPERFYLPWKTENDFAAQATPPPADGLLAKSTVAYDEPYYLTPVETEAYLTDTETNVATAIIDYHTLAPRQLTDPNRVVQQVLFDPLGMVIATSIFKEATNDGPRTGDGDLGQYALPPAATFDHILANKADYLQQATTFFYYNLSAWQEGCAAGRCQPARHISLVRQTHVSELDPGTETVIQAAVGYSDGFGRLIEEKMAVEPGEAILRDDRGQLQRDGNGRSVQGETNQRWLVSGRTVYNNKGKPTQQYLPYYSNTAVYETQQEIVDEALVPPPTVIHYDPLLREIKIDSPKGFFSKVDFTPWETRQYDENDTVKDSPYYKRFVESYPATPTDRQKDEKDALDKAAAFYDTPQIIVLDVLGNTFLEIQNNLGRVPEEVFAAVVSGSVTSQEVWQSLIEQGYLVQPEPGTGEALVTAKFRPYTKGFKAAFTAELADRVKPFATGILNLLRQSCLTAHYSYDLQGRIVEAIDPRLYYANLTEGTTYTNFKYHYAMDAEDDSPAATDSADAGLNLSLDNIFGSFWWNWSARNFEQVIDYDRLQRKVRVRVKGFKNDGTLATDNVVETYTYGESQPRAEARNLRGQLYRLRDQSGVITNSGYSLQGDVLESTRRFTQAYKGYINWDKAVALETDRYARRFAFNALQQVIAETTPDGSVTTNHYNRAGLLDQVRVRLRDGPEQPIVDHIAYNANGQRVSIAYGNGVTTRYTYEATTLNLLKLHSTRPGRDAQGQSRRTVLQDIDYSYDPVGNITRTVDQTHQTIFHDNQKVEPLADYTYDALYRLIEAGGRQHAGVKAMTYRNNESEGSFKQSNYLPLTDNANRLETYREIYAYDEAGNLIETSHIASNSWTRRQEIRPDSNRLKAVQTGNGTVSSKEFSYDRAGNQQELHLNSTVSLTWNCCENLVKAANIKRPGELDDSDYYTYDSDELRTRKVSERMAQGEAVVQIEEKK
ncbi:MAG: toxin TcdB middle/C-terminal domain-containing protein, partial [Anaerolineae bacterium]|nr:toxin TcdB middle/C-terminal domain-containing protein [Anaerolineae bacterium]